MDWLNAASRKITVSTPSRSTARNAITIIARAARDVPFMASAAIPSSWPLSPREFRFIQTTM